MTTTNDPSRPDDFDIQAADAGYNPFPAFTAWAGVRLDEGAWARSLERIASRSDWTPEVLQRARSIVLRAAAVETGAIENLYATDRGFTFTVATQAAAWQATVEARGDEVARLVESQLDAYEYIVDLATNNERITEASIRELHRVMCRGQGTYEVLTDVGVQRQALPLGEYKRQPNHVRTIDKQIHSYAPVVDTAKEMHRLVETLDTAEFRNAHPALQAAWVHYALVGVHPFADGNGRVARALASVYTYRAASVPVLILANHRVEYLRSLEQADKGEPSGFVRFIYRSTIDAMQLIADGVETARAPDLDSSLGEINALFVTRGGYTHHEVDAAGHALADAAVRALREIAAEKSVKGRFTINVADIKKNYASPYDAYRVPVQGGPRVLELQLSTEAPAQAAYRRRYVLLVPRDCDQFDDLLLHTTEDPLNFSAPIADVYPKPSAALDVRLRMWAERTIANGTRELKASAEAYLRSSGY